MATFDSYSETNADGYGNLHNDATKIGQSFNASFGATLNTCQFYLKKTGSPTGNAVAKLYAHSGTYGTSSIATGAALATSGTLNVATLTTSAVLKTFTFA